MKRLVRFMQDKYLKTDGTIDYNDNGDWLDATSIDGLVPDEGRSHPFVGRRAIRGGLIQAAPDRVGGLRLRARRDRHGQQDGAENDDWFPTHGDRGSVNECAEARGEAATSRDFEGCSE